MDALKWNRDFALEQAADDTELLQELIEIFKSSSLTDFETIKKGLAQEDAGMVCAAAHSIKGAAASLGMEGVRQIALEIEEDSRDGSLAVAGRQLQELERLLKLLHEL